jgi:hypothetical protein
MGTIKGVAENQKSESARCHSHCRWDVLIVSRSKEGPAGRGPSLRLAVLPGEIELTGSQKECVPAFRNTTLQQNSSQVSAVANALALSMANATFASHGSNYANSAALCRNRRKSRRDKASAGYAARQVGHKNSAP